MDTDTLLDVIREYLAYFRDDFDKLDPEWDTSHTYDLVYLVEQLDKALSSGYLPPTAWRN
jgi:hypothetical protein